MASPTLRRLAGFLTILVSVSVLAAPGVIAGKPGGGTAPFPPTQYFFHVAPGCDVYQQCTERQPADTTRPSGTTDAVHILKPAPYIVSWAIPSSPWLTLTKRDVLTAHVWADGTIGADGNLDSVRFLVYQNPLGNPGGYLVGSANLTYVAGTGTLTAAGVVDGRFTATVSGIEMSGATLTFALWMPEVGGQVSARFDSASSPSCVAINAGPC